MRKNLRISSLLASALFTTSLLYAQADRFAYAITDIQQEGVNWSYLRKINLQDGEFSTVLLNGTDTKQTAFDATSKKELTTFTTEQNRGYNLQPAFSSGVAAMAYDKKNNRIWYTPMFIDQLRYIDLRTMKVFYVTSQEFTGMARKSPDQGNIITRMTIGNDGNGYAMTNDGAHLVRFTTGKKLTITDLGNVVDDPANKGMSIHSSCSSFGGDMIADNEGNLYIFSARNHVFKVNIETKIATHMGTISGLPANYTSNGAAVTADNKIMIGSAVDANSYYIVDAASWTAAPYKTTGGWRSSDLANSNILDTRQRNQNPVEDFTRIEETDNGLVQIYPNPVINNRFSLQFNKLDPGEYTVQLTDVMGRLLMQRIINVGGKNQTEAITLTESAAKGFYLVKVLDKNSKAVYSKKLIVQ
jgi:Secretion system C-terminal sorting domain